MKRVRKSFTPNNMIKIELPPIYVFNGSRRFRCADFAHVRHCASKLDSALTCRKRSLLVHKV